MAGPHQPREVSSPMSSDWKDEAANPRVTARGLVMICELVRFGTSSRRRHGTSPGSALDSSRTRSGFPFLIEHYCHQMRLQNQTTDAARRADQKLQRGCTFAARVRRELLWKKAVIIRYWEPQKSFLQSCLACKCLRECGVLEVLFADRYRRHHGWRMDAYAPSRWPPQYGYRVTWKEAKRV